MRVPARISIVTLGVSDLGRSAAFYSALGWERCASSQDFSGYFGDPDGYPWEVAFNPFFKLREDGRIRIP